MEQDKLTPLGRQFCAMIEFDSNEVLRLEVRKHWFGLFMVYFLGTAITAIVFGIALVAMSPTSFEGISDAARNLIIATGFLLTITSLIVTAIGAYLYKSNVVLITSEKIAQMLHVSLFNRKISQLSIADVQDVTVIQKGVFAHIFNYGTLTIETAGEQSNYTFTYTPSPYETAKTLVEAHEVDKHVHGN